MNINEYQQLAMRTLNPKLDKRDVLINGVMGLCGESGEAIDIVKKHLAQGHALNREALIKELGDVAWYLAETAYALDVPLEDVLQGNIDKLRARYPQGFEAEKSMQREEDMRIERARPEDAEAVYALYHSLLDAPYGTWSEEYPSRELVESDVKSGKTLVMRTASGEIAAAIALLAPEDEPEYEELASWDETVMRWVILSRLGVAKAHQGRGLARRILSSAMDAAREAGCDGVRFLVARRNLVAQRSYSKLGFDICGTCERWDERWLCYQKRL